MTEDPIWQPLQAELARWIHASRSAKFWLRDDDAVEPTAALDRLIGLANDFDAPCGGAPDLRGGSRLVA